MRWFHSFDTMDFGRISVVVAFATAFWIGLAAIMPEKYHKVGTVILGALQSAITLTMRSGKSRVEKAADKVEAYEAEGIKTGQEIQTLISNEAQEQKERKQAEKK